MSHISMSTALALLLVAQLNSFEFSTIDTTVLAGDSIEITVVAKDPYGGIYPLNATAILSTTKDGLYTYVYPNYAEFTQGICRKKVMVTLADSLALRCTKIDSLGTIVGQSNKFEVLTGPPDKFLVVLAGEQWAPGTPTGRMPTPPNSQDAGVAFDFDVYLTDRWHNVVRFRSDSVYFDATDSFAQLPAGGKLIDGRGTFQATLRQAGQHRITALPGGGSPGKPGASTEFIVRPGVFSQLLLLLPGETPLPGDPTTNPWDTPGKAGQPLTQYARTDFKTTVYACDACWNRVSAPGDSVELGSSFAFQYSPEKAELGDGVEFSTQFIIAKPNQNIWARTIDGRYTTYPSWLDIRARVASIEIVAPDTVRAGDTTDIHVTLKDANLLPVTSAPCRFAVVRGSGMMLDTALLSDTLGRVRARFLCTADHGAEHDTIKVSADIDAYKGIYVDRPDASEIGAFPNPFGFNLESATIFYFLRTAAETWVTIYDPFGNEVRSWHFPGGQRGAMSGINRLQWDGRNAQGRRVANGIYVVQVLSEEHTGTTYRRAHRLGVVW
ncbi:MAG: FlgD immunoglobulin-like domain containing protein [candidate division WOR-3 bacterium]